MKELTCIVCPFGCSLTVEEAENGEIIVAGNRCQRGKAYAESEMREPMRTLTTTVSTKSGEIISVKSENPIPKRLIFDAVAELSSIKVCGNISVGDVVYADILKTGVNIIATKAAR